MRTPTHLRIGTPRGHSKDTAHSLHRTRSASKRAAGAFIKGLTAPLPLIALAILTLTALPPALRAQTTTATSIKFDGKFGSSDSITASAGRFLIPASKGLLKSASNGSDRATLFHSFHDFQLGSGDTAVFQAPASVRNILARVTGPNASSIDGTLRTELDSDSTNKGSANLFLLNPNGIVFGPNARLDIGGSFATSTADSLNLADGASFDARGSADATLSAAPVTAFGFAANPAGPLSLNGSQLEVVPGKHLALIGGPLLLTSGTPSPTDEDSEPQEQGSSLLSPGGTTALFAGGGSGSVPIDLTHLSPTFGQITTPLDATLTMDNTARIDPSGPGSPTVLMHAGTLRLRSDAEIHVDNTGNPPNPGILITANSLQMNSSYLSSTSEGGSSGDISIHVGNSISLEDAALIRSSITAGTGGDIHLSARSLQMTTNSETSRFSRIFTEILGSDTGKAGNIFITLTGNAEIANSIVYSANFRQSFGDFLSSFGPKGYLIGNEPFACGDTGNIHLAARTLNMKQRAHISCSAAYNSPGRAGDVFLNLLQTVALNNSSIVRFTGEGPHRGKIQISAASLQMSDQSEISGGNGGLYEGTAGDISISLTGEARLSTGSTINANTQSSKDAGEISISAGSLIFEGTQRDSSGLDEQYNPASTISSSAILPFIDGSTGGNGGNISIQITGPVILRNYASISTSTYTDGNAGSILLTAQSLLLEGQSGAAPNISSESRRIPGTSGEYTGRAGNIVILVKDSSLLHGGASISSASSTIGPAGSATLNSANRIALNSGSFVSSSNSGTFDSSVAGSVTLIAREISLTDGSSTSASALHSDAGSVRILSDSTILVASGSSVSSSAYRSAGDVTLNAPHQITLSHARVAVTAGSTSPGGDILIDPVFLILDHATLSANAAAGRGGSITLVADNLFNSSSSITATGTTNGIIDIQSPPLQLSTILASLPGGLLDASSQLRPLCSQRIGSDFSSFLILGRGGLPQAPDEFALLIPSETP